jgi:hypothetical protein
MVQGIRELQASSYSPERVEEDAVLVLALQCQGQI